MYQQAFNSGGHSTEIPLSSAVSQTPAPYFWQTWQFNAKPKIGKQTENCIAKMQQKKLYILEAQKIKSKIATIFMILIFTDW